MSDQSTKRESGFSLLEMTIAMALGTLVVGAAVQLYSQAVGVTWKVSQRAELQQDFRAASDMLTKDLSLAGSVPGERHGDPPALRDHSVVWLRSDGEVLPRPQQHRGGDLSLAGCNADSLRSDPGIRSRADPHQQPDTHRCYHGGVRGQFVLLELLPGDRNGEGASDLRAVHHKGSRSPSGFSARGLFAEWRGHAANRER